MNNAEYTDGSGPFEARYLAFLETVTNLRPSLHRYCSRMTGSVLDGEDVVQDALFEAYRNVWSAASPQAKFEDATSWSAQMYTAFVGVDHSWPGWNALRSLLH